MTGAALKDTAAGRATTCDVAVVGAGVIGVAVALVLVRAGLHVRLLEMAEQPGQGASGAFAGLLTTVAEGEAGTAYARLSQRGLVDLQALVDTLPLNGPDDPAAIVAGPHLRAAADDAEAAMLRRYLDRVDLPGVGERAADGRGGFDFLADSVRMVVTGATAHHTSPPDLLRRLLDAARQEGLMLHTGADVARLERHGSRVTGVRLRDGTRIEAGETVLTAGHGCAALAETAGVAVPVTPVRGQMAVVALPARYRFDQVITTGRGYIVPKRGGRVVIGATQERGRDKAFLTLSGLGGLAAIAGIVPVLLQAPVRATFAGVRPVTPSGHPVIGRPPQCDGLILAAGHGSHGVLLSAVTAGIVCDLVASGSADDPDAAAFAPHPQEAI